MRVGASTMLLEKAAPDELLEGIRRFRPTVCFTASTAYRALLDKMQADDVKTLRKRVSAGEALPKPTWDAWKAKTSLSSMESAQPRCCTFSSARRKTRSGRTRPDCPYRDTRPRSSTKKDAICRAARSGDSRCAARPAAAISSTNARAITCRTAGTSRYASVMRVCACGEMAFTVTP